MGDIAALNRTGFLPGLPAQALEQLQQLLEGQHFAAGEINYPARGRNPEILH